MQIWVQITWYHVQQNHQNLLFSIMENPTAGWFLQEQQEEPNRLTCQRVGSGRVGRTD